MDKSKISRHVARNYKKHAMGVSVRFNKSLRDEFVIASAEDKWYEYLNNDCIIERDGYVWSRERVA
jgi:hypothetical protein